MRVTIDELSDIIVKAGLEETVMPPCLHFGQELEPCAKDTIVETVDGLTLIISTNAKGEVAAIEFA